jgi:hypothetical protein
MTDGCLMDMAWCGRMAASVGGTAAAVGGTRVCALSPRHAVEGGGRGRAAMLGGRRRQACQRPERGARGSKPSRNPQLQAQCDVLPQPRQTRGARTGRIQHTHACACFERTPGRQCGIVIIIIISIISIIITSSSGRPVGCMRMLLK